MGTLAQDWLENRRPTKYDPWFDLRLRPGDREGDAAPAERFVFTDDLPEMMHGYIKNKQLDMTTVLSTVQLPCDRCWVEYRSSHARLKIGVLFERASEEFIGNKPDDAIAIGVIVGNGILPATAVYAGSAHNIPFDGPENSWVRMVWSDQTNVPRRQAAETFMFMILDSLFGLFMYMQPRLVVKEKVSVEPALAKSRAKKNKIPLSDFTKVYITVGKRVVKHSADSDSSDSGVGTGSKRRYHKVMFHWKTVTKGGKKELRFIDEYYRGDPSLGIVLHERHIKVAE